MATIQDLASSIAQFEGFNSPGTLAQRNNNPGNLRSWPGVPTGSDGFAHFPTIEAGWSALEQQISLNMNRGLTLSEFFGGKPGVYAGYAPAADANDPGRYASTVASWLGISPDVPLSSAIGGGASSSSAAWSPDVGLSPDTAFSSIADAIGGDTGEASTADAMLGGGLSPIWYGVAAVSVISALWLLFRPR